MPSPLDPIRSFVAEEIARRDALPAGPLSPSDYWKDYNRFSSYIRTLPDGELKLIRYHTWHLTGDNYQNYHFINRKFERELVAGYEALLPRLGGFRPQEPPNSFGVDTPHGRISTSIFRYTVVLDDLHNAGLLPRQGGRRILEIGGGYGGLALLCLQFNPEVSYVICDLEESLFVQGVFLTQHLGPDRVKLVRGEHGDLEDLRPGCVHLLPQSRADALEKVRFDLAINQQSMQEMNLPQVERYCQLLEKCADRFYSCNRNSHNERVVRAKGKV